jgi:hypothetical protein
LTRVDGAYTRDILKPDARALESIASQKISEMGSINFMQLGVSLFQTASLPERGFV